MSMTRHELLQTFANSRLTAFVRLGRHRTTYFTLALTVTLSTMALAAEEQSVSGNLEIFKVGYPTPFYS